ncbi:MAG: hypothetical protein ACYDEQ_03555 [Desulfocucumaceae bacterium]
MGVKNRINLSFLFKHLTYIGILFAAGFWLQLEEYVSDHTEADFTFGICEDCLGKLYPSSAAIREKTGTNTGIRTTKSSRRL